jgi:hypothetical protein
MRTVRRCVRRLATHSSLPVDPVPAELGQQGRGSGPVGATGEQLPSERFDELVTAEAGVGHGWRCSVYLTSVSTRVPRCTVRPELTGANPAGAITYRSAAFPVTPQPSPRLRGRPRSRSSRHEREIA